MHGKKEDCNCNHHRHHHHRHGYPTIVKRTSEKVTIPQDLLEVAEIEEGDFLEIIIRKVHKPSEMKRHHQKHHHE
ncbi:MAG TPA: hypothetical protein VLR54_02430 [Methanobacteriaceae archaeon]|jgi:hypothetical protein|nr:hypothetical protein [Methanobacteriaceae archaeon]